MSGDVTAGLNEFGADLGCVWQPSRWSCLGIHKFVFSCVQESLKGSCSECAKSCSGDCVMLYEDSEVGRRKQRFHGVCPVCDRMALIACRSIVSCELVKCTFVFCDKMT